MAHDWFERQLRIHYDDGVEEHILPLCDKFRWLTPRAVTAGATDAVHSSFVYLRASNAGESLLSITKMFVQRRGNFCALAPVRLSAPKGLLLELIHFLPGHTSPSSSAAFSCIVPSRPKQAQCQDF